MVSIGTQIYADKGCPDGRHPSCLRCPLAECRFEYEYPAWPRPPVRVNGVSKRRTIQVNELLRAGKSTDEVAGELRISRRTVWRKMERP